jgi:hypothetical protein
MAVHPMPEESSRLEAALGQAFLVLAGVAAVPEWPAWGQEVGRECLPWAVRAAEPASQLTVKVLAPDW